VYTPLITRVPVSAGVSIQSTESQTDTYSFPQCESREREREVRVGRAYQIALVLIHFIYLFYLVRKAEAE